MKLIQVVLSLTIVVVSFSLGLVVIESITTPIINEENARQANLAKAEVLPTLVDYTEEVVSSFEDYDVADSGITDIFKVPGFGYVYQAEFQGYQSIIVYMIGINEDGEVTGYKTLQQGDTPGLGAEIANPDNWTQFAGLSLEDAQAGNFDGLAGATVTTNAWKSSVANVLDFHNNEMLGFIITDVTAGYTVPDGVTKVEVVNDGTTDLEVVYTAEFSTQYSSAPNTFTVTVSLTDGSIKKLAVTNATDTDGIGADFGAAEFAEQFKNLAQQDVIDGNYDVQAGASYPITFNGFNTVFEAIYMFHRVEFEGYVEPVETEEQKLERWREELSSEDAVFTDVTGTYDLTDTPITAIELADDTHVLFTITFTGYNQGTPVEVLFGIDLDSNKLSGFRVLSQSETPGLGGEIESEDFINQFDGLSYLAAQYGVFDALGGATVTTNGLIDAFDETIDFYRIEFLGEEDNSGSEPTEAQIFQNNVDAIFGETTTFRKVSSSYTLTDGITDIYEVYDIDGVVLGNLFAVTAEGAGYSANSSITYLIGINADETFAGFRLLSDEETPGIAADYYLSAYWDQFVSVDINLADYPIDETAGATGTHVAIMDSIKDIATFYLTNVLEQEPVRPDPVPASDSFLLQGFAGADNFTSVYLDNPYNESIGNIYEARDASNTLLGYVYVCIAEGNGGTIYYVWGVDLTGQTQQFSILIENETWDQAPGYTGGEDFATSTWLDHYESIAINTLLANPANIDAYAGVTNTTDGVVASIEAVVQYHEDNIGGGS